MPSVHENLKQLRQARGMTQQQTADRICVTRQTISSYESGRTQPDVETLKRLAAVYDVPFEEVLYGMGRGVRLRRLARRVAIAALVWIAAGALISSLLLWAINTFFWVGDGSVETDTQCQIVHTRFAIRDAREIAVRQAANSGFGLLCMIAAGLTIALDPPVSWRARGIWFGVLLLILIVTTLPFAALDPHMYAVEYCLPFYGIPITGALAVLASAIGTWIRKKYRNGGARAERQNRTDL